MTLEQILTGRMLLIRVQRYVAQMHIRYPNGDSSIFDFTSRTGHEAFWIVEKALQTLEREFDAKKRTPKQQRAFLSSSTKGEHVPND